jgi:holo-[acyl-carrier-protein] synthase
MIYGIGIDIVDISRVDFELSKKILGEKELQIYHELKKPDRKKEFLAGRFAAKEAFFKALKLGIGKISFKEVQIVYDKEMGNPEILIQGDSKTLLEQLGLSNFHISITHEKNYAVAVVVVEK